MSLLNAQLYRDVLLHILEFYRHDYNQLFRCSLVNREFNRSASKMLYYRVVVSPPLYLGDTGAITGPSNLPSATLPQYAELVVELEVSGFLTPRPPPRSVLHAILSDALRKFTSLRSIKFVPATFHEDVFIDSLKLLPSFGGSLRELVLNSSCTSDEEKVSLLTGIKDLHKLCLHSPGRAVLQHLPAWLEKNADTLTGLHLLDNCGSVTPGVLKSFLPHVHKNLKAFSLGLSYSITDEDVFTFLSQLPNLEHLRLRNYWQMKPPTRKPGLHRLVSFTADYGSPSFSTCAEVSRFCKWVRRIITASPLQTLRINAEGESGDGEEEDDAAGDIEGSDTFGSDYVKASAVYPAFDSLIGHLARKHATTLRHLRIKSAFVSLNAFRDLLESCRDLESLHLSGGKTMMTRFSELAPLVPNLHTAAFEIRNINKSSFKFGKEEAAEIMQRGLRVRRLAVNGQRWEGSWRTVASEECDFVVEEAVTVLAPWRVWA